MKVTILGLEDYKPPHRRKVPERQSLWHVTFNQHSSLITHERHTPDIYPMSREKQTKGFLRRVSLKWVKKINFSWCDYLRIGNEKCIQNTRKGGLDFKFWWYFAGFIKKTEKVEKLITILVNVFWYLEDNLEAHWNTVFWWRHDSKKKKKEKYANTQAQYVKNI